LGSRESDPESLVQNVSTIHGDYTEVEVDLVVPSPDSLILSRFYSSRDTLQIASLGGWRFNPHCFLTMQKDPEAKTYTDGKGTFERYYVYVGNPDGSILTYVGWKNITNPLKRTLFKIDAEAETVGLANTAKGNISGWTNLKNNELYFDPQANSFELSLCSEGKRFYVKNPSTDLYFITHENLPSGNKVFYEFDTQGQLTLIKETNGSEKKVLAWINIQYSNVIHIQTSDGKTADYHFEQDPSGAHLLTQVNRSDKPDLHYEYQVVDNHALLLKKTLPEGRFLEVDYDSDEENQYKVKSIITPGGLSGITSTQFSYEDHCTQVDGPGNHKVVYRFDGDFQLIAIEQFLDGALYRIHKKSWGKKSDAGNLISTSVEDSEANIFYYKYFVYDNKDKGNIIQEREYGDFTGIGAIPLIIDQNGLVKNHDGHTRNYSYFSGDKTHGFFQRDSNGMGVKYWYKKGTNRLIKKFTLAYGSQDSEEEDEDSGIEQRHFYRYNEDAALTQVIVDDGYEEQVGQTSGIKQRLITTISPKKDLPNLGAPEVIEQKYKDSENGTEVLLKRTVNQFDGQGNVISQAVYDANAEYRYSVTKAYAQGLLILETDPLGYETQYSYDANHNLISESHSDTGISIEYRYDLRNQLIAIVEKDRRRNCWESSISYDSAGYKISEIDRFGNETLYVNDSLGRTISITYPEVGDGQHSTIRPTYTYTYDLFDHQTSVTDPQGRVISKSYNVRSKPTSIQYPDGTKESFRYDSGGNLHHYYGRDGLIQVFEYDEMGRVKHVQHYKRGSQGAEPFKENAYEYNAFHKISETNERDEKTTYIYDKAGRLAILRKDNRKTEFLYDALGRMQGVKKCRGSQAFTLEVKEYDLLDRVIEERTENSKGLILLKSRYVYNDAGQIAQVIGYPQNKESILVQYEYDGFGHLTKTVNTERGITEIFYDDTDPATI
jgi:YD repeat-containing protein